MNNGPGTITRGRLIRRRFKVVGKVTPLADVPDKYLSAGQRVGRALQQLFAARAKAGV